MFLKRLVQFLSLILFILSTQTGLQAIPVGYLLIHSEGFSVKPGEHVSYGASITRLKPLPENTKIYVTFENPLFPDTPIRKEVVFEGIEDEVLMESGPVWGCRLNKSYKINVEIQIPAHEKKKAETILMKKNVLFSYNKWAYMRYVKPWYENELVEEDLKTKAKKEGESH